MPKSQNEDTALICAAYHGKTECVRVLSEAGADMNVQEVAVCSIVGTDI